MACTTVHLLPGTPHVPGTFSVSNIDVLTTKWAYPLEPMLADGGLFTEGCTAETNLYIWSWGQGRFGSHSIVGTQKEVSVVGRILLWLSRLPPSTSIEKYELDLNNMKKKDIQVHRGLRNSFRQQPQRLNISNSKFAFLRPTEHARGITSLQNAGILLFAPSTHDEDRETLWRESLQFPQ